jgi:hypothetical protein
VAADGTSDAALRDLDERLTARDAAHRVGAAPITDLAGLGDFIDDRLLALVSGQSALPSLAAVIAGHAIPGSWWSDPEGGRIYRLLDEAEEHGLRAGPFLTGLIVDAKQTAVAPRLAGAVARIAADPDRRARALDRCSAAATELLALVESAGEVATGSLEQPAKHVRKARLELERSLLVHARSEHADAGHHATVLLPFDRSLIAVAGAPHPPAAYEELLAELAGAALHGAVVAPERDALRWFAFEPDRARVAAALGAVTTARLEVDGRAWLAGAPA